MKISNISNLINKFSYLVKNAVLSKNHEFMVLEKITIPSSKEGNNYFLNPGTALFIEDFSSNGTPIWNIAGWYSSRPFNVDESKLLNLREFFEEVANLLPDGEFFPVSPGGIKEFKISAYNGKLDIIIYFDPKINISIIDNTDSDGGESSVDNIYKIETSKKDPSKQYSVMSSEAINAFSSPKKFLDFIGVRTKYNSRNLLDLPSKISNPED